MDYYNLYLRFGYGRDGGSGASAGAEVTREAGPSLPEGASPDERDGLPEAGPARILERLRTQRPELGASVMSGGLSVDAPDGAFGVRLRVTAESPEEALARGRAAVESASDKETGQLSLIEAQVVPGAGEGEDAVCGGAEGYALCGVAEIAKLLGVGRSTAATLGKRRDFPPPVAQLRMGPVWAAEEVLAFGRKRAADQEARSRALEAESPRVPGVEARREE